MTKTRHAALLACSIALLAPASSLARDSLGTGLPAQTLSTLELDAGFGRRGEVRSAARGGIRFVSFDRVALDPDGRIVVGGAAMVPGSSAQRPCVARFLADGRLDRSFAGGIVALPVRGWIAGLAVDGAGRVVACGEFHGLPATKRPASTYAAVRLRANGRIDGEFSDDGLAESDLPESVYVRTARIDPRDGSILALLGNDRGDGWDSGVVRFTSTGVRDTTFGGDGIAKTTGFEDSLAIDDHGGAILGGWAVVRFGPDGVRDMTFGTGGALKGPLGFDVGGAVDIDGHGRIVLAGYGDHGGSAMFRYLPDGTPDASFDGDGRSPVPFAVPRFHSSFVPLLAAASGDADRYVLVSRLEFLDLVPESGSAYPAGTGYFVQAVDPSNLGALSAFVHSDARMAERANPALTDVVVTPDGSAAIAVGNETVGPRNRKRRTPLLFRVGLTPRNPVPLPDFRIEWTDQPALTATGPDAEGEVLLSGAYPGLPVSVTNSGAAELGSTEVHVWLSDDDRLDPSDRPLNGAFTDSVAAGATVSLVVGTGSVGFRDPSFTGVSGKRLIAVINLDGLRPESDTTNNIAVSDPLP